MRSPRYFIPNGVAPCRSEPKEWIKVWIIRSFTVTFLPALREPKKSSCSYIIFLFIVCVEKRSFWAFAQNDLFFKQKKINLTTTIKRAIQHEHVFPQLLICYFSTLCDIKRLELLSLKSVQHSHESQSAGSLHLVWPAAAVRGRSAVVQTDLSCLQPCRALRWGEVHGEDWK